MSPHRCLLWLLLPSFAANCRSSLVSPPSRSPPSAVTPSTENLIAQRLDAKVRAAVAEHKVVGWSVDIRRRGQVIYAAHGGLANVEFGVPVTEHSRFQIYSVSKLFFNAAFLQQIAAKQIDPTRSLGDYIDGLPAAWRHVTIEDAWSHMSGAPEIPPLEPAQQTPEAAKQAVVQLPLLFPPGTATEYVQTNYLLLREILIDATGEDYLTYLRRHVFAPAGLNNIVFGDTTLVAPDVVTDYEAAPFDPGAIAKRNITFPPYIYTSAGANVTATELAHWFEELRRGAIVDGATLAHYWRQAVHRDGTESYRSYGWERYESEGIVRVGHGGGGRVHLFHYSRVQDPSDHVTVVYLDNGGLEVFDHRALGDSLANEFLSIPWLEAPERGVEFPRQTHQKTKNIKDFGDRLAIVGDE